MGITYPAFAVPFECASGERGMVGGEMPSQAHQSSMKHRVRHPRWNWSTHLSD
jgi:hypothetical protein